MADAVAKPKPGTKITARKQAEGALKQREVNLQAILDATPFPVAVVDLQDDSILFWSRSALALFGHTAPTASEWYRIAYPDPDYRRDVVQRWKPALETARASRETVINTGLYRVTCRDGSERVCELHLGFLADNLVVTFNDVTERYREEDNLRRMATVVRDSNDAITVQDFEGGINAWNRGAERMYGYSEAEALLQNIDRLTTPDKVAEQKDFIRRLVAGEDVTSFETQRVTRDGRVLDVWMTVTRLMDAAGKPIGVASTERDITARKRSERELQQHRNELREANLQLEQRVRQRTVELQERNAALTLNANELSRLSGEFQAIFNATAEGMFLCDPDVGKFLRCNSTCSRLLGSSEAEFLQLHLADIHPQEDLPMVSENMRRFIEAGHAEPAEVRFRRRDGSVFAAEISPSRLDLDGRLVILLTFRDLTQAKEAAARLETARDAAEVATRAKSAFLANMSHEIRTPMNAVLGFAQLLQRDGSLTPAQRRYVDTILRSGEYLLGLINDVLEYSKIEAGRAAIQETAFDLHELLDDLDGMFRQQAESKALRLLMEPCDRSDHYVVTDETKLRQILQNLLANAMKFTEHGGVSVRTAVLEARDGAAGQRLVVEVEDTGPGIAPEEMVRLFQVFEQAEAGRGSKAGTGLGLSISRRFAELLGGSLTVTSEVGRGSRFRLEIPVRKCDESEVQVPAKHRRVAVLEAGQPAVRVLVADDKEDNRDFLAALLASVGFEVRTVDDGAQAVREFEAWKPHVILMDLRMPVMLGAEAIRRVRSMEGGAAVKIIAVTASAFEEDRHVALDAGADDFVSKPFRDVVLFAKIGGLLGVRYRFAEDDDAATPAGKAPGPATDLGAAVAALPADLVAQLREAALRADLDGILELAGQAEARSPEVAGKIRRLVGDFDYEALLTLLDDGKEAS